MRALSQFINEVLLVILCAGLLSCQSKATGPYFESLISVQEETSVVYFYRTKIEGPVHSFEHRVYDGAQKIGALDDNSYFVLHVKPGLHRFNIDRGRRNEVTISLIGGKAYFMRLDVDWVSGFKGMRSYYPYLSSVGELEASDEMRKCRLFLVEESS